MALSHYSGKKKPSPYPSPKTTLEALLNEHLEWLRVKQYSEPTLTTQRAQILFFLDWCKERNLSEPHEITRPILERYQQHLFYYRKKNGEPLSFRTQHSRLSPLRSWFRWMTRQNYILHNPASELELPRQGYHLPKHVLTISEVEQVMMQPNLADPIGLRDRVMLEVLYSTGMRRMELVGLKAYDLDLSGGTVLIRQGKGRKDRIVPIGDRAIAWIGKYMREVRPLLVGEPDDATVFLTNAGEAIDLEYVSHLAHFYVGKAQIGKTGSAHLFRHTMATLMLEGGADIRFIQAMLGHVSLRTTEVYTHVSIRMLKQVHTAAHPGAHLEKKTSTPAPDAQEELQAMLSSGDSEE